MPSNSTGRETSESTARQASVLALALLLPSLVAPCVTVVVNAIAPTFDPWPLVALFSAIISIIIAYALFFRMLEKSPFRSLVKWLLLPLQILLLGTFGYALFMVLSYTVCPPKWH